MSYFGQNPETAPFLNGYGPGRRTGPGDVGYPLTTTDVRARQAESMGALAIFPLSFVAGIPAIVEGSRALRAISTSEGTLHGRGKAWTGIALGVVSIVGFVAYLILR
jgi:hypothetical protein